MQVKYLLKLIKTEPGFELSASRKRFLGRRRTLRCQWRLETRPASERRLMRDRSLGRPQEQLAMQVLLENTMIVKNLSLVTVACGGQRLKACDT